MPTLVMDPPPAEFEALVERRRQLGLDHHDEMWEGVYHMAPAPNAPHSFAGYQLAVLLNDPAGAAGLYVGLEFNLGVQDDHRIPDLGVHRERPTGPWVATAALVVEIISPGDESWEKLPFYAAHDVDEMLIVDPATHSVDWLGLKDGEYRPIERSGLIDLGVSDLVEQIDWPPTE
jgi:Uma2 family endonuclease